MAGLDKYVQIIISFLNAGFLGRRDRNEWSTKRQYKIWGLFQDKDESAESSQGKKHIYLVTEKKQRMSQ